MEPDDIEKAVRKNEERIDRLEKEIRAMKKNRPVVTVVEHTKTMLTVPEAAKFIGMTVKGLRALMHKHLIPYYKPAGIAYFDPDELTEWMKQNRRNVEKPSKDKEGKPDPK